MLRRYWQPAALSEDIPPGGPPLPVRLFGEDLVLFRDEQDRVGLIDLHCSHRRTDLSYGRLEDGGLRCIYHGWLYDVNGRCLETPGEPDGSHLKDYVRHRAYPCRDAGGVIMTYMGTGEPPLLPNYGIFSAPPDHRVTGKFILECNYLQGLEGNMDSVHVQFLHRSVRTKPRTPPPNNYWGPTRVEETEFGVWSYYERDDMSAGPDLVFPSLCLTGGTDFQGRGDGYVVNWRVPIDDTHHYLFKLLFKQSAPLPEKVREAAIAGNRPGAGPARTRANRYLQDREEQRTSTFTGLGFVFPDNDKAANETQGPIYDRTKELLGAEDMSIVAGRKALLGAIQAVQEGRDPPGVIRDPAVNRVDPLFLKKNVPHSDGDMEALFAEMEGRWVAASAR